MPILEEFFVNSVPLVRTVALSCEKNPVQRVQGLRVSSTDILLETPRPLKAGETYQLDVEVPYGDLSFRFAPMAKVGFIFLSDDIFKTTLAFVDMDRSSGSSLRAYIRHQTQYIDMLCGRIGFRRPSDRGLLSFKSAA